MLFNSTEFIFAFFPLTAILFFVLGRRWRGLALSWLVIASLFFYAWWNPVNLLVIVPSVVANFLFGRSIQRLGANGVRAGARLAVLVAGIVFDVAVLGYFKYLNFAATTLNHLTGTNFVVDHVILPLGISFITFQEIAFLIDVHGGQIRSFSLRSFSLFVLFFPQLVAGPIVHYRETMPQFERTSCRFDERSFAVGLTLFCMGLFKKVVLADGIAGHVTPIYAQAAGGSGVPLLSAWAAAVGFTLQIYFDFSGYTDMAIGLARCFGIKLPLNFDSPLKASNIIDFWLRWHVTLTRFLTAYIYNPLALTLTRRRVAKRLPMLGGRKTSVGAFLQVLAGPTLLTMVISGFWHGAGWLFVLWGFVHGVYLTINHGWRLVARKLWRDKARYERLMRPIGFVLTFVSVAFAMVLFRSTTAAGAADLLRGMVGLNGISIPVTLLHPLGLADRLPSFISIVQGGGADLVQVYAWTLALFLIAVLAPNSLQITAHYEPALDFDERPAHTRPFVSWPVWRPTLPWAAAVSALAVVAILWLSPHSEFLYWQF